MDFYNELDHEIKELIDAHEYISFDVFDTILFRNVLQPSDVFGIVENESGINEFEKIRISAEANARIESNSSEISYDEIYNKIRGVSDVELTKAKKLELEIEYKISMSNERITKWLKYAKAKGKKIFIITDMYLSYKEIEKLLLKHNLSEYDDMYVSSEIGSSKADGSMYKHIFTQQGIADKNQWLHIGDNKVSDVLNAQKFGIHSYHYKRHYTAEKSKDLGHSILAATAWNNAENTKEYWVGLGAGIASILHISLLMWLKEATKNLDAVYFLSRDGYIPYHLYKRLRERLYPNLPEPRYLYASRRAYYIPFIAEEDDEKLLDLLTTYSKSFGEVLTLKGVLDNVGLNTDDDILRLKECGIDNIRISVNDDTVTKVKNYLVLRLTEIKEVLKKEKECLLRYLKQEGVFDTNNIGVFDIGWQGTTHYTIQKLAGVDIRGFYLGTNYNIFDEIRKCSKGFLYNSGKPYKVAEMCKKNVMMLETFFSAPHKPVSGFKVDGELVKPTFYNRADDLDEVMEMMISGIEMTFESIINYHDLIVEPSELEVLSSLNSFLNQKDIFSLRNFSQLFNSTGVCNTQNTQKYVTVVDKETFKQNRRSIIIDAQKNLWPSAIIVYDGDTYYSYARFNFSEKLFVRIVKKINRINELVRKGIRNPKKIIKYMKGKIT